MKASFWVGIGIGVLPLLAGLADTTVDFTPQAISIGVEPVITSIQLEGTNVLVLASVPPGFSSVTLEGCRRLNAEGWIPKAVGRLKDTGGQLAFRLPRSSGLELLRVRVQKGGALPDNFFNGPSSFAGQPLSSGNASVNPSGTGTVTATALGPTGVTTSGSQIAPRTVEESDIWKLSGDTLYFFNQYRGLQVIDVSQPDTPVLLGTLPLAAAGEQMYLLDDTHVVLLAGDGCDWGSRSQLLVVEINAGKPLVRASLPIPGTIAESRLVGTALYVASSAYTMVASTNSNVGVFWEWHTILSSFDLSDPSHASLRSTAEIPTSYDSVAMATDRFLFLAGEQMSASASSTWSSIIHVFDISSTDGTFAELFKLAPKGQVKDKFKMNLSGDIFTVVSEQSDGTTWVETLSLANPSSPQNLGSLKLTQAETLYATRFDSNLLYAVTFHQVDPLWVVDLSDAPHPKIAGQLQIPGYSSFLYPWGDRLLAVGRANNAGSQTVVSLFDVHDPANPALLSRATPGGQYSFSEAEYDEKALGVMPELGLILLPFSSFTTNGSVQGVQLIDLNHDFLALRGRVEQQMAARRAFAHRGRILSLSGLELLSVDAADRDNPIVRSTTVLSWPVDRVFLNAQFLLELDYGWASSAGPQLRVALADEPDRVSSRLSLTNLPLLGAALRDNRLYIAQGQSAAVNWQWDAQQQTNLVSTNAGFISLAVLDLSRLPEVTIMGQTQSSTMDTFSG